MPAPGVIEAPATPPVAATGGVRWTLDGWLRGVVLLAFTAPLLWQGMESARPVVPYSRGLVGAAAFAGAAAWVVLLAVAVRRGRRPFEQVVGREWLQADARHFAVGGALLALGTGLVDWSDGSLRMFGDWGGVHALLALLLFLLSVDTNSIRREDPASAEDVSPPLLFGIPAAICAAIALLGWVVARSEPGPLPPFVLTAAVLAVAGAAFAVWLFAGPVPCPASHPPVPPVPGSRWVRQLAALGGGAAGLAAVRLLAPDPGTATALFRFWLAGIVVALAVAVSLAPRPAGGAGAPASP